MIQHIKKLRIVITVLGATLLSACAVGPDFKTPASNAPQTFAHAAHPEFSRQGIEVTWWKLFKDSELSALVDQTLQHNYDLQTARANLLEARALYMEAGLNLAPTITSHAYYTEQKRSVGALNNRAFVPAS